MVLIEKELQMKTFIALLLLGLSGSVQAAPVTKFVIVPEKFYTTNEPMPSTDIVEHQIWCKPTGGSYNLGYLKISMPTLTSLIANYTKLPDGSITCVVKTVVAEGKADKLISDNSPETVFNKTGLIYSSLPSSPSPSGLSLQ